VAKAHPKDCRAVDQRMTVGSVERSSSQMSYAPEEVIRNMMMRRKYKERIKKEKRKKDRQIINVIHNHKTFKKTAVTNQIIFQEMFAMR
jgi:hypothetical protein